MFEAVETGARLLSFAAIPDHAMVLAESATVVKKTPTTVHVWSSGRRAGVRGGTFVFPTDGPDIVIPRGTESKWITIVPPK